MHVCGDNRWLGGVGFTVARDDAWYKRNDEASRVFIHSFAFASDTYDLSNRSRDRFLSIHSSWSKVLSNLFLFASFYPIFARLCPVKFKKSFENINNNDTMTEISDRIQIDSTIQKTIQSFTTHYYLPIVSIYPFSNVQRRYADE